MIGTLIVIGIYLLQFIAVVVCILLGYFVYDKRFSKNHGNEVPKDFEYTNEVSIDPVTGEKIRVYYNSKNGKRFYKNE